MPRSLLGSGLWPPSQTSGRGSSRRRGDPPDHSRIRPGKCTVFWAHSPVSTRHMSNGVFSSCYHYNLSVERAGEQQSYEFDQQEKYSRTSKSAPQMVPPKHKALLGCH